MDLERRPWTLTPSKSKGGKKDGKGKDKESKPKKFDGNCFWCGVYGHMVQDCRKKAAGKPPAPKSPQRSDPKPKGRGKGGNGKNGASSLHEWPDGQEDKTSGENPMRRQRVSSSVLPADTRGTVNETGELEKRSRDRHTTVRWVRESI